MTEYNKAIDVMKKCRICRKSVHSWECTANGLNQFIFYGELVFSGKRNQWLKSIAYNTVFNHLLRIAAENADRKPEWLNRETYDAATAQIRSWPAWKQELYKCLINKTGAEI